MKIKFLPVDFKNRKTSLITLESENEDDEDRLHNLYYELKERDALHKELSAKVI